MDDNNLLTQARAYSLYLSRLLDSGQVDADRLLALCLQPLPQNYFHHFAKWENFYQDLDAEALAKSLRQLRQIVITHILVRDLTRQSSLDEVTQTITRFADFAIIQAERFAHTYYTKMYGDPIGRESGIVQHLSVIAMGKAGGYELNVSSDIDLIFIFPENGETNGKRDRSNQEFFHRVGQKIIALLSDITAEGQVFRVDMRLRPDGDSGPLVMSESALEQYLITQGREWERYAWTKARVVTPYPNHITKLVRPFVFRKYLDFNTYESMRQLHKQICYEVSKKGMGDNVKLGRGGIREIEFIAQIFQMIRGGQMRELQLKGTQETLKKLAQLHILDQNIVDNLLKAYHFLRDVEHRLQYWDDKQTQTLPDNPKQQQLLAQSMGFSDYTSFYNTLQSHRDKVNYVFADILGQSEDDNDVSSQTPLAKVWAHELEGVNAEEVLFNSGFSKPKEVLQRLEQMRYSHKYRHLSEQAKNRFDKIMPQLLEIASHYEPRLQTLSRLLDFFEAILRRSSYVALLHEHPEALKHLASIMSQSAWISCYLIHHPILLDELLNAQLLNNQLVNMVDAQQELIDNLTLCIDDTEAKMDTLRHFQHAYIFRLSVQDLAGLWTIEALSDQLALLADMIIQQAMQHIWQQLIKHHTQIPHFAVIGYGKLGGKELGYSSDLDLVYVYRDKHQDAIEYYSKLANRLTSWLSTATGAGRLYEVDLRLRPNGDAGFASTSMDAFIHYQKKSAWTWEHQAISRARFICGDPAIGEEFEQVRREILSMPRDKASLKIDIITMREKMFDTHPPEDINVKYARGGVVDVEFIVQYLILAYSIQYTDLMDNYGNIALLKISAEHGLISKELALKCSNAYRYYRQIQHNQALRDSVNIDEKTLSILQQHYLNVRSLWQEVFCEKASYIKRK